MASGTKGAEEPLPDPTCSPARTVGATGDELGETRGGDLTEPATRVEADDHRLEKGGTQLLTPCGEGKPAGAGNDGARPPRFLGEYEVLDEIARGGMGIVYKARQVKLNRLVALKLIRDSYLAGPSDLRRFRSEAEAVAGLDHPNIVPIYEVGQVDGQPYFSMKLIEGGNLGLHVERLKADPTAAAALMAKVSRAVHYAHQRTILHRDIKPANILLGSHDEPYVTDFGLAKQIGSEIHSAATMTGAVMGTPAYMPPEQASGGIKSVTTSADVYSLGATFYEMLTGRPPFAGESPAEILRRVLDDEPERPRSINPKLDQDLETICLKCLEKEPDRRYGSAEALADDLDRWIAGLSIMARRAPTWEKALKWVKRRRALASLIAILLVALLGLIGGGIWFTIRLQQERDMANRGRYAADMNLALREVDDRLVYQARAQLKSYLTGPMALKELRSFEWYYLANLCDRSPIRLRGHDKAVICLAFHPDGNRVASGSTDGTVRVWDLAARRAMVIQGAGGPIHGVAFSPDGRWLASGDARGGVRLRELETGGERVLAGHRSGLWSVAFSPRDSRHLLSADAGGLILQWGVETGEIEFRLNHSEPGEPPGPVSVGDGLQPFGGTLAAYTPDGRSILSTGMDQVVRIWDVATHRERDRVRARANIFALAMNPNGRELALAEESPGIEILDLEALHDPRRTVWRASVRFGTVAYSPDERTLATAGHGRAMLLDVGKNQILDEYDDKASLSPFSLAFGAQGHLLAMAVGDEVHVVRVDPSRNGAPVAEGQGSIGRLAASPDERLLALGREDGTIVVFDVPAKRVVQTLTGHGPGVFGLAFVRRPVGAWLVSVGGDGLVQIWDPEAGGLPLHTLRGHSGSVQAVAARPDGLQIATGGEDGLVRTWDAATGRADLPPIDHGAAVSALAYDPTNSSLASGSMDRTVRVWSATSGRRRLGPLSHSDQITGLAFSPDGRLLAAGSGAADKGGEILVWDARSGRISARVPCPRGVDSLSFSSDSQRIATSGSDSLVQVWDATGGQETLSLDGAGGRVSAVLFSPRVLRLYSAGLDGVVKLWDGTETTPAE